MQTYIQQWFFSIDKKTEDELRHAREKSANLREEIRKLKTEWDAERQNYIKTSQELEELKTENQELAEIIQQQRGELLFWHILHTTNN